jgi:hypothetical protein
MPALDEPVLDEEIDGLLRARRCSQPRDVTQVRLVHKVFELLGLIYAEKVGPELGEVRDGVALARFELGFEAPFEGVHELLHLFDAAPLLALVGFGQAQRFANVVALAFDECFELIERHVDEAERGMGDDDGVVVGCGHERE